MVMGEKGVLLEQIRTERGFSSSVAESSEVKNRNFLGCPPEGGKVSRNDAKTTACRQEALSSRVILRAQSFHSGGRREGKKNWRKHGGETRREAANLGRSIFWGRKLLFNSRRFMHGPTGKMRKKRGGGLE